MDPLEDSYVSYERQTFRTRKLDDGSPFPLKKIFDQITWDPQTRNLIATQLWNPSTDKGCFKMEFDLIFSEDLKKVESGTRKWFDINNKVMKTFNYGFEND